MPTAYETYLAAKSGRSETAYQRYLRTKAGSGSANGLVDTPAQSTPEPTKRLGMGDFRQIERGGYTGEPMGVGDLRMIERNEAGARIPNEDASFLSPASVFKGAVSKLATLGERVNRGFFRPVAEKHARIQDVVEPGAERAVSRGMEYGARMSGDFAVEGIPGFANRFVNPEEYRSTAGAQAKEAGAGLLGGGKKFFAQAGEELHQTARDFGVTGEENPMRQIYHDLGADKTFEEAVAEYNQDPSGWLQTATIAKGLGKTGAGLARGVRRGFKPVEKASVEAGLPRGTMPVESVPETVAKSEPKTLTPQISPAENALPPRKVTPEGAAPVSPAKQPTVNTYYRGTNPGATERIKTGDAEWDSYLFVTDNTKSAKMYGDNVETINLKPDAKILREGTSDFVRVAGRWRKGESMLDYSSRAAKAAKDAGYDAIHFKRQTDVGTAILNRNAIEPPVSPQGAAKQPWEMTKGEYYANKAGEIAPINNPYSVVLTGGKTPGSVWHGTSGEGLLGILKDGEIRPRVSRGDKLGQSVVSMSQFPKAADDMGLISLKIKDRGYANRPEASRSVGRGNYVDGF